LEYLAKKMIQNFKKLKKGSKKFNLLYNEDYEIEKSSLNSVSLLLKDDSVWGKKWDYYEVTEWKNGEGYDIFFEKKNAGRQAFSIHFSDLEVFMKLLIEIGAVDSDFFKSRKTK